MPARPHADRDEYQHARNSVGKRFEVTCRDTGDRIEGEVVDWKPRTLTDMRTGERKRGAVSLILETDDGHFVESVAMAPAS